MQRKKEKNLKPSARENKRYLLLEAGKDSEKSKDSLTLSHKRCAQEEVEKAILDYIGILGYSKASPVFISNNILAVNRASLNEIRASLSLAGIKIRRVSGTIKGLGINK